MKKKFIILCVLLIFFFPTLDGKRKKKRLDLPMRRVNFRLERDKFMNNAKICLKNIYNKSYHKKDFAIVVFEDNIYVTDDKYFVAQLMLPKKLQREKKRIDKLVKKNQ